MVVYSTFLLLPLGAGLICGVCVYVTVLVTISLTWRMLVRPHFGDFTSKYRPFPLPVLKSQSNGDFALRALNGERIADVALSGESVPENAGEGGMRSFDNRAVEGADEGKTN